MKEYDFVKTEIIPFKNGELDQFEVKVHWQKEDDSGFVSGFGLTQAEAITDLADSIQKMMESDLELLQRNSIYMDCSENYTRLAQERFLHSKEKLKFKNMQKKILDFVENGLPKKL